MTATMTTYMVRSLDARSGSITEEKIEGASEEDARAIVTRRGLTPLTVKTPGRGLSMEIPGMAKRIKQADLAVFARMLATMIAAGMPMLRALSVLTNQTENQALKTIMKKVTESVQGGHQLSAALAEHPETFPPLMINMVRSGEVGGFLDDALRQVAESTEADVELRSKIKSASTYPIVVICMGVVAAIGMLLFIVPVFSNMFKNLGGELPLATRVVVMIASVVKVGILPVVVVGIVFTIWWRKNKNTEAVRSRLDPIMLRLPIFGPLVRKIAIARFARNLSVMLSSGVQILAALAVVGETAGNTVIREAVAHAAEHVKQGKKLSDHLGDGGVFPDMIVQMVAVGEEVGATDTMLEKIAEFYDHEVKATTDKLASLLEPFLIVAMGIMLGGLIVAMYLPTFKIFELIK
jgi:type IV pilus assembly protein PilC